MKIIAYYLPQFHEIPENNKWWGKGFTEWRNASRAQPMFRGHYQPREPLGDRYYDLLDDKTIVWQMNLAKKYGIYGFCYYHYWFGDGRKLLEKPAERMLNIPDADLPFCFAWANEAWSRTWEGPGGEKHILVNQKYADEKDWKAHFEYLLKFFMASNYIKEGNRPMLLIYRVHKIPCYKPMFAYWEKLAKEAGFDGLYIVQMLSNSLYKKPGMSAYAAYAPAMFFELRDSAAWAVKQNILERLPKLRLPKLIGEYLYDTFDYDKCYQYILNKKYAKNEYMGVFPDFDNTARKGGKADIWKGVSPEKFQRYLEQVIKLSQAENKEYIFLTAWNEWGEGNYMEPDKRYGYAYLKAVRDALQSTGSFNSGNIKRK